MKAMVCTKYGTPDVLQLQEVPTPAPKENELLIKVATSSVTAGDYRIRGLNVPFGFGFIMRLALGFTKPRNAILGSEFCGEVVETGNSVSGFKKGDVVFGMAGMNLGANAEYLTIPETGPVVLKPESLTVEQAAAIPFGATTALYFLRDQGNIQAGQKVLVYGASSAVGVAAVQIAKSFDAEVTAVCSGKNSEMVKSLGADRIIDYTKEEFTGEDISYDILIEVVGKVKSSRCLKVVKKGGSLLMVSGDLWQYFLMPWQCLLSGRKVKGGVTPERQSDMEIIKSLVEKGKLKAVIDSTYPLEEASEAHAYAEKGHKRGALILTMPS